MKALASGVIALVVLLAGALWWVERSAPDAALAFDNPRARLVAPGVPLGGYLTIANHTEREVRLVAASSTTFDRVMIHETRITDGQAQMRHRDNGVPIAPGGRVKFAPGGLHLMLMRPAKELNVGDTVEIILEFDGIEPREHALAFTVVPVTGS